MRSYLIDPIAQTIEAVDYDGDLHTMYALIDCDCVDFVRIGEGDGIFIDDEGMFKEPKHFFAYGTRAQLAALEGVQPLAGRALVVGTDDEGGNAEPKITLEQLQQSVRWLTPKQAQLLHYSAQLRAMRAAEEMESLGITVIMPPALDLMPD